jgi:hypothetical protein
MLPLTPLFIMVAGGFGLAAYTLTRSASWPVNSINRDKRAVEELENPEKMHKAGEEWAEKSGMRKITHTGDTGMLKSIQEHPLTPFSNPTMPGDHDAVVGEKGGRGKGKPLGGGYGG